MESLTRLASSISGPNCYGHVLDTDFYGNVSVIGDKFNNNLILHNELSNKIDLADYGIKDVVSVSVSGDGCMLAIAEESHIHIFNVECKDSLLTMELKRTFTVEELYLLPGSDNLSVVNIHLNSDGNFIYIAMFNKTSGDVQGVHEWDIECDEIIMTDMIYEPVSTKDFGKSIVISKDGNTLVIGDPGVTIRNKNEAGLLYVYELIDNIWVQKSIISLDNPHTLDKFGMSCVVNDDGSFLIVGSYNKDNIDRSGFYFVDIDNDKQSKIAYDKDPSEVLGKSLAATSNMEIIAFGAFNRSSKRGSVPVILME